MVLGTPGMPVGQTGAGYTTVNRRRLGDYFLLVWCWIWLRVGWCCKNCAGRERAQCWGCIACKTQGRAAEEGRDICKKGLLDEETGSGSAGGGCLAYGSTDQKCWKLCSNISGSYGGTGNVLNYQSMGSRLSEPARSLTCSHAQSGEPISRIRRVLAC